MDYQNNVQRKQSLQSEIEHLKDIVKAKEKHLEHLNKHRNGNMIEVKNPMHGLVILDVSRPSKLIYDLYNQPDTKQQLRKDIKQQFDVRYNTKYDKKTELEEVEPEILLQEEIYWNEEEFVDSPFNNI